MPLLPPPRRLDIDRSIIITVLTVIHRGVLLAKPKYNLSVDNFSLCSQQMVSNYFFYPCISERFGANFDQINIPLQRAAISALNI